MSGLGRRLGIDGGRQHSPEDSARRCLEALASAERADWFIVLDNFDGPDDLTFDAAVLEALKSADAGPLLSLSPETLEAAGECGLRSIMTMLGIAGAVRGAIRVFSYEGPFGVGYCNALWEPSDAGVLHSVRC